MSVFWWLAVPLTIIWSLVYGELSLRQVAAGFLISTVLLWILRNYFDSARRLSPAWIARRTWYALIYLAIFMKDLAVANVDVAWRTLHPRLPIHPGIVAVRIPTRSDLETTVVASAITLTPGELVVEIDPDERIFYIHCIDARQPQALREERLRYLEQYQARIFR